MKNTNIKRLDRVWAQGCVEEMIDGVKENERGRIRNGGYWKCQMAGRQNDYRWESEKKDEERNGWNEEGLKRNKIGKTREDTRWEGWEFVITKGKWRISEKKDKAWKKREKTEIVESIESPRFNWNKTVVIKTPKMMERIEWKGKRK